MNFDNYKLMAYDKLQQDIREVCQINMAESTCLLFVQKNVRTTVERLFKDVVFLNSTGRKDINEIVIIEGHIIESILSADKMIVKYGEYDSYCPVDRSVMKNVGFYVSAKNYSDMPLGPTEEYAEIVGHIKINPELFEEEY